MAVQEEEGSGKRARGKEREGGGDIVGNSSSTKARTLPEEEACELSNDYWHRSAKELSFQKAYLCCLVGF